MQIAKNKNGLGLIDTLAGALILSITVIAVARIVSFSESRVQNLRHRLIVESIESEMRNKLMDTIYRYVEWTTVPDPSAPTPRTPCQTADGDFANFLNTNELQLPSSGVTLRLLADNGVPPAIFQDFSGRTNPFLSESGATQFSTALARCGSVANTYPANGRAPTLNGTTTSYFFCFEIAGLPYQPALVEARYTPVDVVQGAQVGLACNLLAGNPRRLGTLSYSVYWRAADRGMVHYQVKRGFIVDGSR